MTFGPFCICQCDQKSTLCSDRVIGHAVSRRFISLSPWRPGINPREVHLGSLVDIVVLGQVFITVLWLSPISYHFTLLHFLTYQVGLVQWAHLLSVTGCSANCKNK